MEKNGFTLVREEDVSELSGVARLWRHTATGAELLSVCNNDENKCFGVSFRTPPPDSTGVAHILEHSVLCGSDKYPVREPFVELLKGSLQTFLNAFTYPDKTCYPVASTNRQDFYNLVDVYLDAVFHPRISEDIFRQEGWHVEAEAPDAPWTFKGVVYNEMKGVYSSPDSVLAEQSQQSLFPDTLYSLDSGGNPEVILSLTYENFKNFHTSYYHPSNARFFFWGDDPEDRRLEILEKELAQYTARPVRSEVPLQPHRDTPRQVEIAYAASEGEDRALFTVNWLLCETADVETALILEMLEHILEGLPGSPLRKALIESGLGEDMTGCGLESDLRQMYYSVGLKGVAGSDVPAAELLIFETLAQLVEEGVNPAAIEAAVNSVEFDLRENNSGRFPRGLAAMVQSLSTWLYDGDPLATLRWEAPLASIKARLAQGEKVFEQTLKTFFLDNEHRTTVVLLPDTGLAARREEAEAGRLSGIQAACSAAERKELTAETIRLRTAQETPDSPEALATIPGLELADLPVENVILPMETRQAAHMPFMAHDIDTSGIAYVNMLFPLNRVPARLLPLVPLLGRALTEMGTLRHDFVQTGMRIAGKTGGIWAHPFLATRLDTRAPLAWLNVGGKVVRDKVGDLFELLQELLLEPGLKRGDDVRQRFGQMLLEAKARLEHGLLASGHSAVSTRLRAQYTVGGWVSECTSGISYLESVRELLRRVDDDWDDVQDDLRELCNLVVQGKHALCDCTADGALLSVVQEQAAALWNALPQDDSAPLAQWEIPHYAKGQAFTAPSQINYVGKAANVYDLGYRFHGSALVIMRYLRMGYLWEKVRVQGGAYGAFCNLDRRSGTLVQASYRDPAVDGTLRAYDSVGDFLRGFTPDSRELTRAIVGAIGDVDAYMLPDAKGAAALVQFVTGDSAELRQQMRDEILGTTARHFRDFAAVMDAAATHGTVCALGGSAVENAAREHGWQVQKLL